MSKDRMMNFMKKIVIGCLTVAMIVGGTVIVTKTAKAAEDIVKGEIIYSPMNMATYWNDTSKTAPVKPNYIFAGWYTVDESKNVIAIQQADGIPKDITTYAKFVPSYVLSVKTQVETKAEVASTATKPDSTFLRVLSSVDSGDYQDVGFEILLGDSEVILEVSPITKVYEGLKLSAEDKEAITPNNVFGTAAKYFTALDMKNISSVSFGSKIYIRPYWTTLDGTKVEGLAKNVRVEDKYTDYQYINVPINLLTDGANPTQVAAGVVEVSYDATKGEVATDADGKVRIDTGRLFAEMEYRVVAPMEGETKGKIIFVGNGLDITKDIKADGLFANIRFKSNSGDKLKESDLNLTKTVKEFCDWEENSETVIAW